MFNTEADQEFDGFLTMTLDRFALASHKHRLFTEAKQLEFTGIKSKTAVPSEYQKFKGQWLQKRQYLSDMLEMVKRQYN